MNKFFSLNHHKKNSAQTSLPPKLESQNPQDNMYSKETDFEFSGSFY